MPPLTGGVGVGIGVGVCIGVGIGIGIGIGRGRGDDQLLGHSLDNADKGSPVHRQVKVRNPLDLTRELRDGLVDAAERMNREVDVVRAVVLEVEGDALGAVSKK